MTDFDEWSKSERVWMSLWRFFPDGRSQIVDTTERYVEDHIQFLAEHRMLGDVTEYRAIKAFKEFKETGRPVTMPSYQKYGNLLFRLQAAYAALFNLGFYRFITIYKKVDGESFYIGKVIEPISNWR